MGEAVADRWPKAGFCRPGRSPQTRRRGEPLAVGRILQAQVGAWAIPAGLETRRWLILAGGFPWGNGTPFPQGRGFPGFTPKLGRSKGTF
ncbi:MAG: hypothetical protein VKI82_06610 [Leptolyngbya sp.]|nr:hypothetical protein [Leptolyngbya sp.]